VKVRQALKISEIISGRAIPSDMFDEHLVYYSKSKDLWINVMDMDIAHLVRAFAIAYEKAQDLEGTEARMRKILEQTIRELQQ
tara:strand:+ start:806 stop:1054 length:249 start_codon:yes stop_codon:yes gene_type:complete